MRGKPELTRRMTRTLRNIPAYAGKTLQLQPDQVILEEHPRVCGENCFIIIAIIFACGTSPRMRGKLALCQKLVKRVRNIPAYAGKTCLTYRKTQLPPEHPRVCGENHPRVLTQTLLKRNIPAYAGKTRVQNDPYPNS